MAELTSNDRRVIHALYMSDISSKREALPLLKAELRVAIDAIDTWVNDNQTAFNSAIPLPARTTLTASQKAALLMYVVRKRYEIGV